MAIAANERGGSVFSWGVCKFTSVEVFMTKLNKALMATTAIAFTGGLALPASAQKAPDPSAAPGVVKSGKKVKLRLYGQITRQFGFVNDGSP